MTKADSQLDRPFKILLIGDSAVGKTSFMFRFADDRFTETFTPTIGVDFKLKTICVRDKKVNLQLWDTAGQEKFANIVRSYYRNAHAIILMYDRTNAGSFQSISRWMRTIDDDAPSDVHRVLVANKSDLHSRLVISTQDGKQLADKYQLDFFEASAKADSSEKISQIFYSITEKLLERRQSFIQSPSLKLNESTNRSSPIYEKVISCC